MRYDYKCSKCDGSFEVEKSIKDPHPRGCPLCGKRGGVERILNTLSLLYANRPPWTYKECLKYKTCKHNDGPRVKIDPNKHGDLGAWNSPGEVINS